MDDIERYEGSVDGKVVTGDLDVSGLGAVGNESAFDFRHVAAPNHGLEGLAAAMEKNFRGDHTLERVTCSIAHGDGLAPCPACYQQVSMDWRRKLESALTELGDTHLAEFREAASAVKLGVSKVLGDTGALAGLFGSELEKLRGDVAALNREIKEWNNFVEQRKRNPSLQASFDPEKIEAAHSAVVAALADIRKKRDAHNATVSDQKKVGERLSARNWEITSLEVSRAASAFRDARRGTNKLAEEHALAGVELEDAKSVLTEIEAQEANLTVAVDRINWLLSLIYLSDNRLEVRTHTSDEGGVEYRIRSRGESVPPSALSTSERNAIALSYFFTASGPENRSEQGVGRLLVLDDPVSSFDSDTRVGVTSLLTHELSAVSCEEERRRVILLTHDMLLFSDLRRGLGHRQRGLANQLRRSAGFRQLAETQEAPQAEPLSGGELQLADQYRQLVRRAYDFAVEPDPSSLSPEALTIGNVMRRALEAFSTFIYRVGPTQLFSQGDVKFLLGEAQADRFSAASSRLFLHGESHTEDTAKITPEQLDVPRLSVAEMQRVTRLRLAGIEELQKAHIAACFEGIEGAVEQVRAWNPGASREELS